MMIILLSHNNSHHQGKVRYSFALDAHSAPLSRIEDLRKVDRGTPKSSATAASLALALPTYQCAHFSLHPQKCRCSNGKPVYGIHEAFDAFPMYAVESCSWKMRTCVYLSHTRKTLQAKNPRLCALTASTTKLRKEKILKE